MANVAYYYIYGKGVELNPEKSAEWFVKAINSGWIDSNQDLPRVRKIIELMQVAKTGDVEAWANLADDLRGIGASLESRGDDPQKAYTESYQWAKQAAEAGHPKGMRILAAALLFYHSVQLGHHTDLFPGFPGTN
jgi:TPR repeat protein